MEKSGKERAKKGGPGKNPVPKHTQFSSTNQPDPAKAKATKAKKRFTRELVKQMLNTKYKFQDSSQIKQQLVAAFGPEVANMTVGEIMTLQQANKAILKGDTFAFQNLLNQAFGLPKQKHELGGEDGEPIKFEEKKSSIDPSKLSPDVLKALYESIKTNEPK